MHVLEIIYLLAALACCCLLGLGFSMRKKNKALGIYDYISNVDNMEYYIERMVLGRNPLSLLETLKYRGFMEALSDIVFVPYLPTELSLKDLPVEYRKVIDNAEHTEEGLIDMLDKLLYMFSEDPCVSGKRSMDSVVEMYKRHKEKLSLKKKARENLLIKGGDLDGLRTEYNAFLQVCSETFNNDLDVESILKCFLYQDNTMGKLERHRIPEHFKRILAPTFRVASRDGVSIEDKKYLLIVAMKRLIIEVEAIQTTE